MEYRTQGDEPQKGRTSIRLSRIIHGGIGILSPLFASAIQTNRRSDKITPQREIKNTDILDLLRN